MWQATKNWSKPDQQLENRSIFKYFSFSLTKVLRLPVIMLWSHLAITAITSPAKIPASGLLVDRHAIFRSSLDDNLVGQLTSALQQHSSVVHCPKCVYWFPSCLYYGPAALQWVFPFGYYHPDSGADSPFVNCQIIQPRACPRLVMATNWHGPDEKVNTNDSAIRQAQNGVWGILSKLQR